VSAATVTGQAVGRASVTVQANGYSAATAISVVPQGTLAVTSDSDGVIVFNLDGSNYRRLTSNVALDANWGSSRRIAFDANTAGMNGNGIYTVDSSGALVTADVGVGGFDAYPQWSRDGTWIYYTHYASNGGGIASTAVTWRVHDDGTGAVALTLLPDSGFDVRPSPSPDGQQYVYVRDQGGGIVDLRIATIATSTFAALGILGHSPHWAPTTNHIAYIGTIGDTQAGTLNIVQTDGTGSRIVSGNMYDFSIDWSPDEAWLVARNDVTRKIEIVNVSSGMILPLGYTGTVGAPTYRPY
jgi:Tol biopolymer transport system component